jgi:hypothetical protein
MTDTNPPAAEPRRKGPDSYRGIGQPPPTTVEGVIAELEAFESFRRIHNDGVAPGQFNVRLMDPAYVIAKGNFGHDGANFARILADELDRKSARVEELEGQLAALDGWSARIVGGEVEIRHDGDDRRLSGRDLPVGAVLAFIADAEEPIGPDTLCPCGKVNDGTGSGYCSGEHFDKYDGGSDEM